MVDILAWRDGETEPFDGSSAERYCGSGKIAPSTPVDYSDNAVGHLQHMFDKTDTHRQAELVRPLLTIIP
jgi:hypothetical protein